MIIKAVTVMARDRAMVPQMAHVVAEVRGKEATGICGRGQVMMPVPTSLINRYSDARYRTFNGNERQKVWQNSKGRPKDDDTTPSNQISVSEVTLSEMSTKISTLSDQQDATNHRVDNFYDGIST